MSIIDLEGLIEEVKTRSDIVDVIGRSVVLKRAGSNYKGLCPFHGEKTPSFVVSREKQIFTCFGCGATGDVIEFVKRFENLSFQESVEKLAGELGIQVKHTSGKEEEKRDRLYEISASCARYFYKNLRNGDNPGIRYIIKRGLDPETARKFGIGYAPEDWQGLTAFMSKKGVSPKQLEELGLAAKGKKGYYDKFRNRVIFPIFNTQGKVIGFGGRAIGEDAVPKYLNSSESAIFKKKNNLYGLHLAKKEIGRQNLAILVEGYMDVVSLVRCGVENVVATLGTALTVQQASLLKRYTDQVVLSYDSDPAGQAAALRGIDILQEAGLNVRILQIESGKDPDEYIRKNGKNAFDLLVKNAIPFMEYKIQGIKAKYDIKTTEGSIRFLEEISSELRKIKSPVQQAAYINQVAEMTKIPASSIMREMDRPEKKHEAQSSVRREEGAEKKENSSFSQDHDTPVRKILLRLMLDDESYIERAAEQPDIVALFAETPYEALLDGLRKEYVKYGAVDPKRLKETLAEETQALLADILQNVPRQIHQEKSFLQCVSRLHRDRLETRRKEILNIMQILNEEEDQKEIEGLTRELIEIGNLLKEAL